MNELTKTTDKNRCNGIYEEMIKAVSRYERNKPYSSYVCWYQFPIFKSLAAYLHNLEYFLPRQENEVHVSIFGNIRLITGFIDHYVRFMNEMESADGNGIDISCNFLLVIMPYFIMVALQDVHH